MRQVLLITFNLHFALIDDKCDILCFMFQMKQHLQELYALVRYTYIHAFNFGHQLFSNYLFIQKSYLYDNFIGFYVHTCIRIIAFDLVISRGF